MTAYLTFAGGVAAIIGAVLPWLNLDGGLQHYNGTIGPYGWLIVAAGALALAIGALAFRTRHSWFTPAVVALGLGLSAFAVWLIVGLQQVLHRPEYAMFAPTAGPGLFVILGGAILIVCSAVPKAVSTQAETEAHS